MREKKKMRGKGEAERFMFFTKSLVRSYLLIFMTFAAE